MSSENKNIIIAVALLIIAMLALSMIFNHDYLIDKSYEALRNLVLSITAIVGVVLLTWRSVLQHNQTAEIIKSNNMEREKIDHEIEKNKNADFMAMYNSSIERLIDGDDSDSLNHVIAIKQLTDLAIVLSKNEYKTIKKERYILDINQILCIFIQKNLPKSRDYAYKLKLSPIQPEPESASSNSASPASYRFRYLTITDLSRPFEKTVKDMESHYSKLMWENRPKKRNDIQEAIYGLGKISLLAEEILKNEVSLIANLEGTFGEKFSLIDLKKISDYRFKNEFTRNALSVYSQHSKTENYKSLSGSLFSNYTFKGIYAGIDISETSFINCTINNCLLINLQDRIRESTDITSFILKTSFYQSTIIESEFAYKRIQDSDFGYTQCFESWFKKCSFKNFQWDLPTREAMPDFENCEGVTTDETTKRPDFSK